MAGAGISVAMGILVQLKRPGWIGASQAFRDFGRRSDKDDHLNALPGKTSPDAAICPADDDEVHALPGQPRRQAFRLRRRVFQVFAPDYLRGVRVTVKQSEPFVVVKVCRRFPLR